VRLHITDTGVGMSAEQLDHAFEPFNRLGRESAGIEGTGIGLPIVKALVETMGGSVQVHSRVGLGTRAEVRLPAALPGAAPTRDATPPTPPPLASGRPARLLYIEDNPVNAMIVQDLVALRANTTVHIATTGLAGVQQALELGPDLVLVDMQLPDIDGFEVLRRLREQPQTAHTVCVVLSADAMPDVIQRALRAGFAAYWTKPLDFGRFLSGLDELLGG
jgi:CheY-like chemotaxis protein